MSARNSYCRLVLTASEENILRAALARRRDAATHWQRWLATNRLDDIDRTCFALLPLIYQNLSAQGYAGEELGKLRGIYRHAWYRNQLLIDVTGQIAQVLHQDAVAPVVFDDLALLRWVGAELGGRTVSHARLLVPAPRVIEVLDRAQELGWELSNGDYPDVDIQRFKGLARSDGLKLEIHWYLAGRHAYSGVGDPIWIGAVGGWADHPELHSLSVTDQLLSTLVAGFEARPNRSLRWIPDAIALIDSPGGPVDWERLVKLAVGTGQRLVVQDGLEHVFSYSTSEIPVTVIEQLSEVGYQDRIEHWFRLRSSDPYPWRSLPASWFQYRHQMASEGRGASPVRFVRRRARVSGAVVRARQIFRSGGEL